MGSALKYVAYSPFEKHLNNTMQDHSALIYMFVVPCAYERRQIVECVATKLQKKLIKLDCSTHSWSLVFEQLHTPDLFGNKASQCIYWDGIDEIKDHNGLLTYVQHPTPGTLLAIGSGQMQAVADIYNKGKKEIVVLDLSQEKPWERQNRLNDVIVAEAHREGKQLQNGAFLALWQRIGADLSALQQELRKLICYIGEDKEISIADVTAISAQDEQTSSWQLAEQMLFACEVVPRIRSRDLSFAIAFIGQLRYLLHNGIKIADAVAIGKSPESAVQVKPALLQKYLDCLHRRSLRYFSKAAHVLYMCELDLKSSSVDSSIILDKLAGEFRCL